MAAGNILLVGCGILKNEVRWLAEKNHWSLDMTFLDSTLHVDFHKLADSLLGALDVHVGQKTIVLYGACHPRMDAMLEERNLSRIPGQNCVEMLLGHVRFTDELANGAFFLLEDWAHRWNAVISEALGTDPKLVRRVFQDDRRYILGLRTPCSGDFTTEAQQIAALVGLPLRWTDASLEYLETLLREAIERETGGATCPT
jgi:hypothetical protein